MSARAAAAEALAARLGHAFTDPAILERALTHASVGDGARRSVRDNERLEFLGDRVLGLLVAEHLLADDPAASEGDIAPRLNALVSREACAAVARRLELGPALRLSGGETRTGGRDKTSILAGAMEAVIAAVYEDGGLPAARAVFDRTWPPEFDRLAAAPRPKDSKTELQERTLARGLPLPAYAVTAREGPEHAPVFTVAVAVDGAEPASGQGGSRQAAEKAAARAFLDREARPA